VADRSGKDDTPSFVAGLSIFEDVEDAPTTIDASSLFREHENVPYYPAMATFGRFELLGRLAMGGMAEIFLAREVVQGVPRHLVIKRVLPHVADDEDFIRMFLDEAKIATRLYHPNVCHMYEGGQIEGSYFMAMEWVHGVPLRRLIRRSRDTGGIPVPVGLKVLSHVAEALHYCHHACDADGRPLQIVHRDVSPHNVMVSHSGLVKLLDFGIAKASTQAEKTEAGVIKGKYSYLSPEQCRGGEVDARSDIFALGVCLFETVTGKPLYHRGTVLNTMTAIVHEDVPSARRAVPELPVEIDMIIRTALAKDPEDRFQTAREMHDAIEHFLASHDLAIDAHRIGSHLATVFDDEERLPLPNVGLGTGSHPALTPGGVSASFGPFGARERGRNDSVEAMLGELEVELPPPSAPPPPPAAIVGGLPPVETRRRRGWVAAAWIAAGVAAIGAGALAAWLFLS
jgi:serine/threonine-protein kinase